MSVGFHTLCSLWEAQRGRISTKHERLRCTQDKNWNDHTGLIYGLHRSATTLKPLGENNIDHLVTMQCSVGKPGVLALMWIFWPCLKTLQIPICSSFCDNPQDPMDLLPKSWCPTLQLSVVANPWLYHCCYNMSIQDKKTTIPIKHHVYGSQLQCYILIIMQTQTHSKLIAYEWMWLNVMGH